MGVRTTEELALLDWHASRIRGNFLDSSTKQQLPFTWEKWKDEFELQMLAEATRCAKELYTATLSAADLIGAISKVSK
jgi:hypothetical protein